MSETNASGLLCQQRGDRGCNHTGTCASVAAAEHLTRTTGATGSGYWWCPECKEELAWHHVTLCDPAGIVRENALARDQLTALSMLLDEAKAKLTRYTEAEKELPEEPEWVGRGRMYQTPDWRAMLDYIDKLRDNAIAQAARVKELQAANVTTEELWYQLRTILVPASGDPFNGLFEAAQAVVTVLATARKDERERCAKLAELHPDTLESNGPAGSGQFKATSKIAKAIRALTDEQEQK